MVDIIVISGPSGAGKSSVGRELERKYPDKYEVARSVTTRVSREDNEFYSFVSTDVFLSMEEAGSFLESNRYEGNQHYYGTPISEVERIVVDNHRTAVLDIDVNGREQIMKKRDSYQVLSVFVVAPVSVIYERLLKRGESHKTAIKRISASIKEINKGKTYDFVIVNEIFNETVSELYAVISGRKSRSVDLELYIEDTKKFLKKMEGKKLGKKL